MTQPLRLLMVEDSPDDADLTLRRLGRAGYEITHQRVDSPEHFIAAIREGQWDLVLCDYSMPHFSGFDALKILRDNNYDIPFIFLSGTLGEEVAISALHRGAQDYVMKNNAERLIPAIQRAVREFEDRRERVRMQKQINQLQRFESIGRLAGGIAHDFNNLLGIIGGFAEIGREETTDAATRERFERIRDQAKHGASLTSQLLAFARRQVLQPQFVDLNKLITDTLKLVGNLFGRSIAIHPNLSSNLRVTHVDPTQIEQVLMNLLLNAKDALPRGGQIVITTENVDLSEEFLRTHPFMKKGIYVVVTVSDTGTGMDAATRDQIFEPFFTTKESGKGTGLGLATVYGIVKQHDGIVEVESEIGRGSTFRVYIPAVPGIADKYVTPGKRASPVPGGPNETILFVDDDDELRQLAADWLMSRGYQVITAADGAEAVVKFRDASKSIKLAILDLTMPNLSGDEAYRQMCTILPDLAVVFTSGHPAATPATSALIASGVTFLPKPYSFATLSRTVRDVLDASAVTRPLEN